MWVLELNDINLSVRQDGALRYSAPAIAVVERNKLLFGLDANTQFRVNPSICHAQYVQKLNQERIPADRRLPLTQADLLYQHLQQVRTRCKIPRREPIWVVVPSDTSLDQVGLLLSILRAAEFNPIDFLDAAFAAATIEKDLDYAVLLDLGLNRTTIAKLAFNSQLEVLGAQSFQTVGLLGLINNWVNEIANRSLIESRFDPRVFGETEQQLYEQLMIGIREQKELFTFNIKHRGEDRHVAILDVDLAQSALNLYDSLVDALDGAQNVILTSFISLLPGFNDHLSRKGLRVFSCLEDWTTETTKLIPEREDFRAEERNFWREVPLGTSHHHTGNAAPSAHSHDDPSHILEGSVAYALEPSYTARSQDLGKELFSISKQGNEWWLDLHESVSCLVNDETVKSNVRVSKGSTIRVGNQQFKLISVVDG